MPICGLARPGPLSPHLSPSTIPLFLAPALGAPPLPPRPPPSDPPPPTPFCRPALLSGWTLLPPSLPLTLPPPAPSCPPPYTHQRLDLAASLIKVADASRSLGDDGPAAAHDLLAQAGQLLLATQAVSAAGGLDAALRAKLDQLTRALEAQRAPEGAAAGQQQ